jgi:hypothetical protein
MDHGQPPQQRKQQQWQQEERQEERQEEEEEDWEEEEEEEDEEEEEETLALNEQQLTASLITSKAVGRDRDTASPVPGLLLLPSHFLSSPPVFDEGTLQDVFAEEQKDGRDAKEKCVEGREDMEEKDTEGEKGEKEEDDDRVMVEEENGDQTSDDMLLAQQQQQQQQQQQEQQPQEEEEQRQHDHHQQHEQHQHQQQQQHLILHPILQGAVGRKGDGLPTIDGGPVSYVPPLPSLTSPFPGPAPVFSEGMLQDVFAEGEKGRDVNVGVDRGAGRGVGEAKRRGQNEGENDKEREEKEVREEEEEEEEEGEKEEEEGASDGILMESEKEMLDLFEDDIENW